MYLQFTLVLVSVLKFTTCARILAIVPTPSYSHQIAFKPLWKELSLRGHQVTLLTTDPINNSSLTNITEIDISFSYKTLRDELESLIHKSQTSVYQYLLGHMRIFNVICDEQLSHPQVKSLIQNKNEHFDLLIAEAMNPIMFNFAKRFNCPYIGVATFDTSEDTNALLGNPTDVLLYPNFYLPDSPTNMLLGRLQILMKKLQMTIIHSITFKTEEANTVKHFGEEYLPLMDTVYNMSLLFTNSNPIFNPPKALVPAIIRTGGAIHIQPEKPLPKDLKKTLDESKGGFIYFSLGSNVNSKDLSANTRNIILETFSELPYTVLWKFELESLPGQPKNVIISKWFPQHDVFRHPNIKLFITHGGLQSLDETIHFKIPIIGLPVFADQPHNIRAMAEKGVGLELDFKTLDKKSFKEAILEVMNNPKYRNRIKELSDLVIDEPMTGLERAIWWTEYVLRHKGAKHLRSPLLDLPFYQYYMLDIFAFCSFVFTIFVFLVVLVTKKICRLVRYLTGKFKTKID